VDELVGTAEIALRLGVSGPSLVNDWRRRYADFPEPVATVSSVHVWAWPDVRAWAERTGRLRGADRRKGESRRRRGWN
jgi:hypothetical protein